MRNLKTVSICAILIFAGVGCGGSVSVTEKNPLVKKIGSNCKVQLRRGDGLGAGGGNPIPAMTDSINGAEVSITGNLRSAGDGWIVVQVRNSDVCIPRESILLIEFSP